MKKNYSIEQCVGLSIEGRFFDLHNCFDFKGFDFHVEDKRVCLVFEINGDFSTECDIAVLWIKFDEVSLFELSDNFFCCVTDSLVEIGYKNPQDRDTDWLIGQRESASEDHLFFRFSEDHYIRIYSKVSTVGFSQM